VFIIGSFIKQTEFESSLYKRIVERTYSFIAPMTANCLFCEFDACLQHVEVPVPTPKIDEVLLKVEAVSLNPFDWKVQKGMLRPLLPRKFPHIPGKSVLPLLPATLTSVLMVFAF